MNQIVGSGEVVKVQGNVRVKTIPQVGPFDVGVADGVVFDRASEVVESVRGSIGVGNCHVGGSFHEEDIGSFGDEGRVVGTGWKEWGWCEVWFD